jgi:glucosamine--fructose-6-phosphate aminotransferase (isomerizing)
VALRDEIREQPAAAERLLAEGAEDVRALARAVRRARVPFVIVAARGTSDHAATYAQYALGAVARLPVALATPSLLTRYGVAPRSRRALTIGISQSGRSPDVVEVVADARRQGGVTAALTNDPTSPLARAAEYLVALRAGPELSVAATKTYTAALLAVAMLAAELGEERHGVELAAVPDAMHGALAEEEAAAAAAAAHRSMEDAVVLGRGFNLATAAEWSLKLKELAYVRAQGYSTADFQHGPSASLAPGGHLLAVSAAGPMREELLSVLAGLREERRAQVVMVSGQPSDAAVADSHIPFPDTLPEWLSPLTAIIPMQLFCYHLATAKGLELETPRGLRKVTLTR